MTATPSPSQRSGPPRRAQKHATASRAPCPSFSSQPAAHRETATPPSRGLTPETTSTENRLQRRDLPIPASPSRPTTRHEAASLRLVTFTPRAAGTAVRRIPLHREKSGHRRGSNFLSAFNVQDFRDGLRSTHQRRMLPVPASPCGRQRTKKQLNLRAAASRLGRREQLSRSIAVPRISGHSTRQLFPPAPP